MKNVYVSLMSLFLFFMSVNMVEARSGCCSHHGGVCGCGCCDGSSLSSTCAPYYPQCDGPAPTINPTPKPTFIPLPTIKPSPKVTSTPIPTITSRATPLPSVLPTVEPTSTPHVLGANTSNSISSNWTTVIVASLVGVGAHHLFMKNKKNRS